MSMRELKELLAVVEEDPTEIGWLILEESLKGRWVDPVITEYAKRMYRLGTIMEEESYSYVSSSSSYKNKMLYDQNGCICCRFKDTTNSYRYYHCHHNY
ncbi:unnamed protein product [Camellia sinensis]